MSHRAQAFAGFPPNESYSANFLTDGDWTKANWDGKAEWTGVSDKVLPISFGVDFEPPVLVKEIIAVSRQDDPNVPLTDTLTFSKHGASRLFPYYVNEKDENIGLAPDSEWGGGIANNLVLRRFKIDPPALMGSASIRVYQSPDGNTNPLTQIVVVGV